MAKDNITPEERLLKIIENPNVKIRPLPIGAKIKSLGRAPLKSLFAGFHIDKNDFKKFNLKLANKVMVIICALITFIWLYNFINMGIKLAKRFRQITIDTVQTGQEEAKLPKIDVSIDEAATEIKRRNMFTFLPSKEEAQAAVNIGLTLGNLKLVGILWSDNPQAMIENSKEQKTYFVSKSDRIGDIEIRNILRDKVIVGKGTEEWELR